MSIKGTKTEQNLLKAFAGESQARMRYDYFSKQAKKEGLEAIECDLYEDEILENIELSDMQKKNELKNN